MKKDLEYYMKLPYTIELVPSYEGGFAVRIVELPGCVSQGETLEEAYRMIEDAKRCWIELALEEGRKIPEPIDDEFSGKFIVRMPKSLHKVLSERARKENVSLNQYVVYQLAKNLGYKNN